MESDFTQFWLETFGIMANADTIDARVEDQDIGGSFGDNQEAEANDE
jgi:hypothetical protein